MKHTRREFLHTLSAGAAVASLARFGISPSWAQSAPTDYKALVCIFLFGGNDGNNVVIGADTAGYAEYSAVRGAASGINIAQSELLAIQPKNTSRVFGLHPSLAKVHPLFASGQLAVLANVGPLNRPTTKAAYLAGTDNPYQLFSHADQQAQWQTTFSDEPSRTGWGGRLADAVKSMNGSAAMPVSTSIAGNVLFAQGSATSPLTVPSSGTFGLSDSGTNSIARARQQALAALLGEGRDHTLVMESADGLANAINLSTIVNPVISATNTTIQSLFNTTGNSLALQLQQVAKLIAARDTFGVKRQVFFVSLGGFDTHTGQLNTQVNLLTQVGDAMKSFYDATATLGVADKVTSFTLSDFGRTFKPAAGGGSDHAWGNHHFIMGGAVKGGAMYGTFPSLALTGPDDVSSEGRWLPSTSVDQYAATLATWFGVTDAQLSAVLPNLSAFPTKNLGFL